MEEEQLEYGERLTSPECPVTSVDNDEFKALFKIFKSYDYKQLMEQGLSYFAHPLKEFALQKSNVCSFPLSCKPPSDISVINANEIETPFPVILEPGIGTLPDQNLFGLKPKSSWKISKFKFPEGLVFIRNPFTAEGQRYWISTCLREYVKPPHITNISNLEKRNCSGKKGWRIGITSDDEFYKKLRWVTFGYHHNWDTKVYSEDNKCDFPQDLYDLTRYIATVLGFQDFRAEAAIVNYYNFDSTLSGHQDRSEENLEAPLFSISFGQSAVFLIGGETKDIRPAAVHLQSGDVVVMSGKSRLSYHGVPKIIKSEERPWLEAKLKSQSPVISTLDEPDSKKSRMETQEKATSDGNVADVGENLSSWEDFLEDYAGRCRINLNVRQKL